MDSLENHERVLAVSRLLDRAPDGADPWTFEFTGVDTGADS